MSGACWAHRSCALILFRACAFKMGKRAQPAHGKPGLKGLARWGTGPPFMPHALGQPMATNEQNKGREWAEKGRVVRHALWAFSIPGAV